MTKQLWAIIKFTNFYKFHHNFIKYHFSCQISYATNILKNFTTLALTQIVSTYFHLLETTEWQMRQA